MRISRPLLYSFLALVIGALAISCEKGDYRNGQIDLGGKLATLFVSNASDSARLGIGVLQLKTNQFILDQTVDSEVFSGTGITADDKGSVLIQIGLRREVVLYDNLTSLGADEIPVTRFKVKDTTAVLRDVAYDPKRELLYLSSSEDSTLYVYAKPTTIPSGNIEPTRTIRLNYMPWGLDFDETNNRLFVSQYQSSNFVVYSNPHLVTNTSKVGQIFSVFNLVNPRGIAYCDTLDMLGITGVGDETGTDGIVVFLTEVNDLIDQGEEFIAPTYTYQGIDAQLGVPIDIAFDPREDYMEFVIADAASTGGLLKYTIPQSNEDNIPQNQLPLDYMPYTSGVGGVHIFRR